MVDGHRGNFTLEKVTCDDRIVYDQVGKFGLADLPWMTSPIFRPVKPTDQCRHCRFIPRTPLRIKFQNRYKADLPFHVLIRACLRRMSALLNAFGKGEPELDYRDLVRRAEGVTIDAQDLRWFDWRRFSFRQDQAMLMGGMVGEVTYRNVPGVFMPLLDFCKKVHLGKQTAFGLGQIGIVSLPIKERAGNMRTREAAGEWM